ncbi:short chain dehydrogenase domain-containing protein [Sarocladium implicatum]|nr:short chain dehydrogenase domain-containing protein [Sarocladium implicatum]
MATATNVLISGASRGIGKGFLEHYLRQPNHIVIAALRDIFSPNAKALLELPVGEGSRVVLIKVEAASTTDSFAAAKELEAQGITKLDIIIANAATVGNQGPIESIDPRDVADVYVINAAGPALLFMGLKPLLDRAENPKWMAMSSAVASIEDYQKYMFFKMFPYNASKAALNHFTKTIHAEYQNIIAFAVSPGFVETEMGKNAVKAYGIEDPPFSELTQVVKSITERNNITCVPSKPAPSRPRLKPTSQDIRERLVRCEALLQEFAAVDDGSPSRPGQAATTSSNNKNIASNNTEAIGESQKRHADGDLFLTLNEEILKMKNLIEQDQSEIPFSEGNASSDFSSSTPQGTTDSPTLDPITAFKLWQIYLERVNPLLKIVHAPTVQSLIVSTTADIEKAPLDQQALIYSIFGVAVSALRSDEIASMLGAGKQRDEFLEHFLTAVSVSLARFGSFARHNMTVLQALLHNSIMLMSQCKKHAAWVQLGALVRIAMSLGYHRDGTHLSLSPFETEMRRRIWWQIVFFDIKLGIDSGLTHSSVPEHFDAKPPLNLNDADLFPDAAEPLVHKEGPTEMAFVIVIARISAYLLDNKARQAMEANVLGQSVDASLLKHNQLLVQQLDADLVEIETRFIPSAASHIHATALAIRPHIIKRLHDIMYPMEKLPDWGTDVLSPRDSLFKLTLSSCENASNSYEKMERWGFAWYIRLHFNFDLFASLATSLFHSPATALGNRAWAVLDSVYARQTLLDSHRPKAAITPLQFILKAFAERERILADMGQIIAVPELIARLRQMHQLHTLSAPASTDMNAETAVKSSLGNFMHDKTGTQHLEGFMLQNNRGEGFSESYEFWPGALWNADWGQGYSESTL